MNQEKLFRLIHPEITKAGDPSDPIIEFVASDETLDRYEEVITAGGWNLDNYQRNPVFQNSHMYGDILHTLGRAELTEVRGDKLFQRVRFAVDANPVARIAFDLYRGKYLNAVSVGFYPIEWVDGNKTDGWRRKYIRQELLEVSAVAIPANPSALALAAKSGAIDLDSVEQAIDLLTALTRQFRKQDTGPEANAAATGSGSQVTACLPLLRDLHSVLHR